MSVSHLPVGALNYKDPWGANANAPQLVNETGNDGEDCLYVAGAQSHPPTVPSKMNSLSERVVTGDGAGVFSNYKWPSVKFYLHDTSNGGNMYVDLNTGAPTLRTGTSCHRATTSSVFSGFSEKVTIKGRVNAVIQNGVYVRTYPSSSLVSVRRALKIY